MHRPLAIAAAVLLLSAPSALSAQEPPKPVLALEPPADASHPSGRAVLVYTLDQAAPLVEIDVLDAKGNVVAGWSGGEKYRQAVDVADRLLLSEALTKPGRQTVTWDLRASGYFAAGAEGAPPKYSPGPIVPPGRYTVQVSALGQTVKQPLNVVSSLPLAATSEADLQAQFELAMQVRGSASAASRAIRRARAIEARVKSKLQGTTDASTTEAGQALLRRVDEILGAGTEPPSADAGVLALYKALAALEIQVESAGRPTEARLDRYRILSGALQARILTLNGLSSGSFARFERGDTAAQAATPFSATTIRYDSKGVDFGPWVRTFMATVNRNLTIPRTAGTAQGRVVVTFVAHKSGSVTAILVATPSGVETFNDAARKAIYAASLTDPLPSAFPGESCQFSVTFYFNEKPPAGPPAKK